MTDSQYS